MSEVIQCDHCAKVVPTRETFVRMWTSETTYLDRSMSTHGPGTVPSDYCTKCFAELRGKLEELGFPL